MAPWASSKDGASAKSNDLNQVRSSQLYISHAATGRCFNISSSSSLLLQLLSAMHADFHLPQITGALGPSNEILCNLQVLL